MDEHSPKFERFLRDTARKIRERELSELRERIRAAHPLPDERERLPPVRSIPAQSQYPDFVSSYEYEGAPQDQVGSTSWTQKIKAKWNKLYWWWVMEGEGGWTGMVVGFTMLAAFLATPVLLVWWAWSTWKHAAASAGASAVDIAAGWGVSAWDWSLAGGQWVWWIAGAILLVVGRRFIWPVTQVIIALAGVTLTVCLLLFALVGIGGSGGREGRH